jgi:quinol monooxygenase YgiN
MVIEKVELNVKPGQEEDCLKYLAETRAVIAQAPACLSYVFGRGVENPDKVFLVVGWESLEAHRAATQRPEHGQFSKGLVAFVAGASVEHFAVAG